MYPEILTNMLYRKLSQLQILVIIGLLSACGSYDFTLNAKLLKRPQQLFTDYRIDDKHLHRCIKQAIFDNKISQASELEDLNCSHAGIISISGLEGFSHLKRVKLSHNKIGNIDNIRTLQKLEVLHISHNRILDFLPTLSLAQLQELDVSNNPNLKCPIKLQLKNIRKVILPKHCTKRMR